MKLTEGHELDRKSVARQQRPRPCCFNHLGQNDDHRREIGTRGHIDLWTGRREATERAPCCARDGEDHARPTKHEKAAGITRAAFLVSRSVALTTVVPSQWNHCSGWDASGPRAIVHLGNAFTRACKAVALSCLRSIRSNVSLI